VNKSRLCTCVLHLVQRSPYQAMEENPRTPPPLERLSKASATGILAGDAICFLSRTASQSECEAKIAVPLTGTVDDLLSTYSVLFSASRDIPLMNPRNLAFVSYSH
jgi:hypothetical protein